MKRQSDYDYERVWISGCLRCSADLHIGGGSVGIRPKTEHDPAREYPELCLDSQKRPYVPASTVRGFLGERLRAHTEPKQWRYLIGEARPEAQKSDVEIGAGRLRVYDAVLADGATADELFRNRSKINPRTGTAQDHHLYSMPVVPEGSAFTLRLELDHVTDADITALLGALHALNADGFALGRGKNVGQGQMRWTVDTLDALGRKEFNEWLHGEATELPKRQPLDNKAFADVASSSRGEFTLNAQLLPLAPMLINDPDLDSHQEHEPGIRFLRDNRDPNTPRMLIAGSTLKGMLRARCRRILLTMMFAQTEVAVGSPNEVEAAGDALLGEIFGSTGQRGRLRFDMASARYQPSEGHEKGDVHEQMFNAIDRFTGGVAKRALYNVEAVYVERIAVRCHLAEALLEEAWVLGLLLLALRDLIEGDVAIGWGKNRGYGAFRLHIELPKGGVLEDWQSVMERYGKTSETAVQALEKRIDDTIKALPKKEDVA